MTELNARGMQLKMALGKSTDELLTTNDIPQILHLLDNGAIFNNEIDQMLSMINMGNKSFKSGSIAERLQYLKQHPEIAQKFLETLNKGLFGIGIPTVGGTYFYNNFYQQNNNLR